MNNLYQEAQRDDWHGQIVPRDLAVVLKMKPNQKVSARDIDALDTLMGIVNSPEYQEEMNRQMANLVIFGTTHPENYQDFPKD